MKNIKFIFAILLIITSVGQVTADLYLPSLPAIASALSVHVNLVQLSISLYMYGYACSQLIYGPISDGVGRRKPLLVGLFLLLLGNVICVSATSIGWLITGRFLQGLGAGSGTSLARVILRDIFQGTQLVKLVSYVSVCNVFLITGAPLLGGYIQYFLGWRMNFVFLTFYSVMTILLVIFCLPETNKYCDIKQLKLKQILNNIYTLIKTPVFIGSSGIVLLTYAGILAWLTVGPILLQTTLHITPIMFGWISVIVGSTYAIGATLNGKLVVKLGINRLVTFGIILKLIGSLIMLFFTLTHILNFWVIIVPVMIFVFGASMTFSNVFTTAVMPFPKIAGIACSIFGFLQITGGALSSTLLAYTHEDTQAPLAITLTMISSLALIIFILVKKYNKALTH